MDSAFLRSFPASPPGKNLIWINFSKSFSNLRR